MSILRGYLVIHEVERGDRTEHGVASSAQEYERTNSPVTALEAARNQLAYCEALQASGKPGTEGRYFIAEYREVSE